MTAQPYTDVQRNALKAAVLFALLGIALMGYGVLHFVGVVRAGAIYGVILCCCGAASLWLTGRVIWGVYRERARSCRSDSH